MTGLTDVEARRVERREQAQNTHDPLVEVNYPAYGLNSFLCPSYHFRVELLRLSCGSFRY